MEKAYAQAIETTLAKGTSENELMTSLMKHLTTTGRLKLLPAIVRELRIRAKRGEVQGATLEVATDGEVAAALEACGVQNPTVVINPTLIRGWRLREGGRLMDRSAKRSLIDLYRRIAS